MRTKIDGIIGGLALVSNLSLITRNLVSPGFFVGILYKILKQFALHFPFITTQHFLMLFGSKIICNEKN